MTAIVPRAVSSLWWKRYLSRNACSWDELEQFPRLKPDAQHRTLAQRLLAQLQYFSTREDALPEWREAARITNPDELWSAWPSLPILNKESLQTRFIAQETKRLCGLPGRLNSTGGSTGEAVHFYHDDAFVRSTMAVNIFTRLQMGWQQGMPTVIVWGSERDIRKETSRKNAWNNRLLNDYVVDGYRMTDETVDRVLEILRGGGPAAIYGFTSMLEFVAQRVIDRGEQPPPGTVRTAWNGGEMLFEQQNATFRKAFGVPILNRYGGRELSTIAYQDAAGEPLKVLRPWIFLEIVNADGKPAAAGESGRLICTSTVCRGTPFLRYEVGDLGASAEASRDESGIFALDELHGRIASLLELPDGRKINNIYWNHLFKEYPEIKQFQVVLRADKTLDILLRGEGFRHEREAHIRGTLQHFLESVPFRFRWVDEIPRTSQGKLIQVVREQAASS
jgi:phenylacetate-CoA ligase